MRFREEHLGKICWYLAELIPSAILYKNRLGQFDINDYSEDFFKDLFNEIYGLKLINVNEIQANFPAIDLGDEASRICHQVTSERDRSKIDYTISQFLKYELYKKYDDLYILILTRKRNYKNEFDTQGKFKLSIVDPEDVLEDIKKLSVEKQKSVLNFLEKELQVSPSKDDYENAVDSEFHSELDRIRELIKLYKPITALDLLDKFKSRNWEKCSDIVKFRITTNRAACLTQITKYDEAGKLFIEALQYKPDDEKALYNAANGYLFLKNKVSAKELAQKAIAKNPLSTHAYACLLLSEFKTKTIEEQIKELPREILEDSTISFAIANLYSRVQDYEKAINWGELALLRSDSDKFQIEGQVGGVMLHKLSIDCNLEQCSRPTPELYDVLERCFELLNSSTEKLKNTEIIDQNLDYFRNRGSCKFLKGNVEDAIDDIKFVLARNPDDLEARKQLSTYYLQLEDIINAIKVMTYFESNNIDVTGSLMLADLYRMNKQLDKTIELCDPVIAKENSDSIHYQSAVNAKAAAIAEIEQFPSSLDKIESLLSSSPNNLGLLNIKAKLLRVNDEREKAKEVVLLSLSLLSTDTKPMDKAYLAREVFDANLYNESVPILEELVSGNPFHPESKTLLLAYYNTRDYKSALELLNILNLNDRIDEQTTEVEAAIHDELGDLNKSAEAYKRFLNKNKDSLNITTRLGVIYYRLNNPDKLDELLNQPIEINYHKESIECVITYANLLLLQGFSTRPLETLYELRRVHHKASSKPHAAFFEFFLHREQDLDKSLDMENIQAGCWFKYRLNDGLEFEFLLEDRQPTSLRGIERNLDDQIVKIFLGKKVGDTVVLKKGITSLEATVLEIKHKLVFAFQESAELLNSHFIDDNCLHKFSLPDDFGKSGNLPDEMMQMLKAGEEKAKAFEVYLQNYNDKKFTIEILSKFGRRSILEQLEMLIIEDKNIIVSQLGNPEEKFFYKKSVNSSSSITLDFTSAFTLNLLGILNEVKKYFDDIYTYQSIIDLINEEIQRRSAFSGKPEGSLGVYSENGEIKHELRSKEMVDKNLSFLTDFRDWIQQNTIVSDIKGSLSFKHEEVEELDNVLGKPIAHALYVANDNKSCIATEDFVSREIFRTQYNQKVTSVKTICDILFQNGLLTPKKYYDSTIKLVCMGYMFTEVDHLTVMHLLKERNFECNFEFDAVAKLLEGKKSTIEGAAELIAMVFFDLWKESLIDIKESIIIGVLLSSFTKHRDTDKSLDLLKSKTKKHFNLLPIQYEELVAKIDAWNKAKIIVT